jgi:hypothetical protein
MSGLYRKSLITTVGGNDVCIWREILFVVGAGSRRMYRRADGTVVLGVTEVIVTS